MGVPVHRRFDLDELEQDRGLSFAAHIDHTGNDLPVSSLLGIATDPSGTEEVHNYRQDSGRLNQSGDIGKLLLCVLADHHGSDQNEFDEAMESEVLREPAMDGTRQGGRHGWTERSICALYRSRIEQGKTREDCADAVAAADDGSDILARSILVAIAYSLSPTAMAVEVASHVQAATSKNETLHHAFAIACVVAGVIQGVDFRQIASLVAMNQNKLLSFKRKNSSDGQSVQSYARPSSQPEYDSTGEQAAISWFDQIVKGIDSVGQQIDPPPYGVLLYGQGDGVHSVVGSASYCALRFPDDFSKAMSCAVQGGGQSTTRASLVGCMLGARVGLRGIPSHLIGGLDDHESIIAMAQQVARDALERRVGSDSWRFRLVPGE